MFAKCENISILAIIMRILIDSSAANLWEQKRTEDEKNNYWTVLQNK